MDIACRKSHTFCYLCHYEVSGHQLPFGSSYQAWLALPRLSRSSFWIPWVITHCQRWPPSVRRQSQTSHRKDTPASGHLVYKHSWTGLTLTFSQEVIFPLVFWIPSPAAFLEPFPCWDFQRPTLILLDLLFQHLKLFMFLPLKKPSFYLPFPSQPNF